MLIPSFQNTIPRTFIYFIFLPTGVGLIILGLLIPSTTPLGTEYLITNQRVLIYPHPHARSEDPQIINLYEINGEIEMNYNKASGRGSIYIPTPHWIRLGYVQSSLTSFGKAIISPDITGIKEPHIAYDILVELLHVEKA